MRSSVSNFDFCRATHLPAHADRSPNPMPFLDYHLPSDLIAQQPAAERDRSRLLVVRRADATLEHRVFADLPGLLAPGDLVVLNDTRVLLARLIGRRERTGGRWEGLFLAEHGGVWEMLCQTRGTLTVGEAVMVEDLRLIYVGRTPDRNFLFRPEPSAPAVELLAHVGRVPLPPYIRKGVAATADAERYQTVFAHTPGSVAAPTAGLHFTPAVLDRLRERNITTAFVTLHVGLGTFQPLQHDDPAKHVMHAEWCELSQPTADAIAACRARGGRVVAVGTTAVRTLETARGLPFRGPTSLYIHEPYTFTIVDAMVTNFHLPRTSLLLLVGAFAGDELLRRTYEVAVADRYRFYSYGDAMLIL
ncbi:MAG: tRNA preQ1(34) S-adenosylmethionine ribosyltransferase-isomerase QueA [Gemmataceae bacterium]